MKRGILFYIPVEYKRKIRKKKNFSINHARVIASSYFCYPIVFERKKNIHNKPNVNENCMELECIR